MTPLDLIVISHVMEPDDTIYILENIIYESSDDRFLVMFQMHKPSFWQLVKELQGADE